MSPLTKTGRKVLRHFKSEYGKVKGKQIFYATMNKYKARSSKWHHKR